MANHTCFRTSIHSKTTVFFNRVTQCILTFKQKHWKNVCHFTSYAYLYTISTTDTIMMYNRIYIHTHPWNWCVRNLSFEIQMNLQLCVFVYDDDVVKCDNNNITALWIWITIYITLYFCIYTDLFRCFIFSCNINFK